MDNRPYLPRSLPPGLEALAELTTDLRWTWSHAADALWNMMDPDIWEQTRNPYIILQNLTEERLTELCTDTVFRERLQRVTSAREDYCCRAGWYGETHAGSGIRGIAYFSMEFGLGEALPLYAGGLGILAGDYLKAASDLNVPVVGIGLLYQEGYFRQLLNVDGWQREIYPYNDPTSLPVTPVYASTGAWLHVYSDFPGRRVRFRVWQARVGRITLYLLDSNDPLNSPGDRGITGKLYGGGQEVRLMQEIALGICGWRVIEALGLDIDICHLNEGHAAFVTLERARCYMDRHGVDFWEALWITRAGNVFTTHTPVAAGFDTFPQDLVERYGRDFAGGLGVEPRQLAALGRRDGGNHDEPFNMAYLAMRTCMSANGVSRLHGEVSRQILGVLYPRWPEREVPVGYVTNGVHVSSWDSPWADEIWTAAASKGRWLGAPEPLAEAIENLTDQQLWAFRGLERSDLVDYVRQRLARQLGQRGSEPDVIAQAGDILDANVLTLGFARRFAAYKRPNLMLHDAARLTRILANHEHPVQLIVAGKAHPEDAVGKEFIRQWAVFARRHEVRHRVVFLEDYDMGLAQQLVQGVDVWINNPRRPWEACGTSGMKVLVNGGLNVSELDGWWAEAWRPGVGWALGDGREHDDDPAWDAAEAEQLYDLLEREIAPRFYARDAVGVPQEWVGMMRASMAELAPRFSTNRMIREYIEQQYLPAAQAFAARSAAGGALGKSLRDWETRLRRHWQGIHFGQLQTRREGESWIFELQVYLGDISPAAVAVQMYADPLADHDGGVRVTMDPVEKIPGATNGFLCRAVIADPRPAQAFTPRVIPCHPSAAVPAELPLISWRR